MEINYLGKTSNSGSAQVVSSRVTNSTADGLEENEMTEQKELLLTIKEIMDKAESTSFLKEKQKFENEFYAYSLCDDYKSRKTEKVVLYMLYKKNINIFHYTDDYQYVIFINFLRWCQINNLPVKKMYHAFLKYNIFTNPECEKFFEFFLKPAIENDKLLWNVDRDLFKEQISSYNLKRKKEKKEKTEEKKEEGKDAIRNSVDKDINLDASNDILDYFSASSSSHSTDSDCESSSSSSSESESESDSTSEYPSEFKSQLKSSFGDESKNRLNGHNNKKLISSEGSEERKMEIKDVLSKKNIEKEVMTTWNDRYLNGVVEAIISQRNRDENYKKIEEEIKKKENVEHLTESLLKKFVTASDNEREEIKNLQTKIRSMETIIKYLIQEILRRNMTHSVHVRESNLNNCFVNKMECENMKKCNEESGFHYQKENKEKIEATGKEKAYDKEKTCDKDKKDEEEVDSNYFGSYNDLEIHRTMILDKGRTNSYYRFINENKNLFKGKTVLDVGCGSGIISLFCSDFCKMVVGIDNADMILKQAEKIVKNNDATNIFLFKGKLEEHTIYIDEKEKIYYLSNNIDIEKFEKSNNVKLQLLQFDIIISEWMGYFLFYECMIDTILHARNVYLKKGGYIFPNKINLYVSGYDDTLYWKENVQVWENKIYNKFFKELKPDVKSFLQNGKIMKTKKNNVVTDMILYYTIDLYEYKKKHFYVYTNFKIPIPENKIVTSLCFHFDCVFEPLAMNTGKCINVKNAEREKETPVDKSANETDVICNSQVTCNQINLDKMAPDKVITAETTFNSDSTKSTSSVVLSTNPLCEQTHWKQTVLHLYDPDYNLLSISTVSASTDDDTNVIGTSDGVNVSKKLMHFLTGKICVAPQSKHTRNISIVLEIDKNESLNIKDNLICYHNLD